MSLWGNLVTERSIVIMGLPSSGKTTYLAALWHLIFSREIETQLRFGGLEKGDFSHLNAIAERWREGVVQDRTAVPGSQLVSMKLQNPQGGTVKATFPDLPGEAYQRMWENRDCEDYVANILRGGEVQLFIHSDTIRAPQWVTDEVGISRKIGIEVPNDEPPQEWEPKLAPTQVQLIDLLQMLHRAPLNVGPRRLAIMLSAWDKASPDDLSPEDFLKSKLPLLWQYLKRNGDSWTFRIYGLSAQGGDYDSNDSRGHTVSEANELRALDQASKRIRVVGSGVQSNDLTEPLEWLMR